MSGEIMLRYALITHTASHFLLVAGHFIHPILQLSGVSSQLPRHRSPSPRHHCSLEPSLWIPILDWMIHLD